MKIIWVEKTYRWGDVSLYDTYIPSTLQDFEKTLAKTQQKTFKIKDMLKGFAVLGFKYAFVSL